MWAGQENSRKWNPRPSAHLPPTPPLATFHPQDRTQDSLPSFELPKLPPFPAALLFLTQRDKAYQSPTPFSRHPNPETPVTPWAANLSAAPLASPWHSCAPCLVSTRPSAPPPPVLQTAFQSPILRHPAPSSLVTLSSISLARDSLSGPLTPPPAPPAPRPQLHLPLPSAPRSRAAPPRPASPQRSALGVRPGGPVLPMPGAGAGGARFRSPRAPAPQLQPRSPPGPRPATLSQFAATAGRK